MNSNADLWNEILKLLARDLSDTAVSTWFGDCRVLEVQDNLLLLHCPSEYSREIILTRYADLLKKVLKEIFAADFEISILTTEEMEQYLELTERFLCSLQSRAAAFQEEGKGE